MMCTIISLIFISIIPTSSQSNETEIRAHLLASSSSFIRPVYDVTTPVIVTFGFELIHIVSIVESHQTITGKVWLRMSWYNNRTRWNESQYGGVERTRVSSQDVWTPDIFLHEDISTDMSVGPDKYRTLIIVHSSGKHEWNVPALLDVSCIFYVVNFPFDRQSCTLRFTSWTHDQLELDIVEDPRPIVTSNYINSSEWDLISVNRVVRSTYYECCDNPFVDVTYTIILKRRPLYYIYGVVIPCFIQMCIILFTFFLPPESGERIGVVITVLLVFAVYLEVLNSSLPKTSTSTPALSRFYIITMAECACSLIATCVVLVIHFKGTEKGVGPVPEYIREYFLNSLAKYIGIRKNKRQYNDEGILTLVRNLSQNGTYANVPNGYKYAEKVPPSDMNHRRMTITKSTIPWNTDPDDKDPEKDNGEEVRNSLSQLVEEVRIITALIHDMNRQDEIEEEWQTLGKVIDRISFFIFLFIFVGSSLALLVPLYTHNELHEANVEMDLH